MAMEPQLNPELPIKMDINGMFVGKSVTIYGEVKNDNPVRFGINLRAGNSIALHFNPRFHENQVVRNTFDGGWGREERDGGFSFVPGKKFYVCILCEADHFRMQANSYRTFGVYKHRIPYHTVDSLEIVGDCIVKAIYSGIQGLEIPVRSLASTPMPAKVEIPFFNIKHHSVTVVGKPTTNGRFSINFFNENGNRNFFHFNPRLEQKEIVRNTNEGGWGREERELDIPFPFMKDVPFMVKIFVNKVAFRVELNGSQILQYSHRLRPLKAIKLLTVEQDVAVENISFA